MRCLTLILLALVASATFAAADPRPREIMNAAELKLALRKLQVTGTALYVAAHPDDENTAFLTYLNRGRLVRAAYLSVTRGDGGQNLIGSESGEQLGVIRTQELLAARRIDGAEQFFTQAIDFGYSKTPDETLALWDRERVLGDMVWVIRSFRPDLIITRFGTDGSGGHGHHTASAILAEEAFRAAADSTRYAEQLSRVSTWQASRIVWNAFRPELENRDGARPKLIQIDVGSYNGLLGRSYTEIAGQSRSMHKSQGFGAAERRGSIPNYFEHRGGKPAERDLFDGIDLTWSRVKGGAPVGTLLRDVERAFDPDHPDRILPALLKVDAALAGLKAEPFIAAKRRELREIIRSCAGLWVEAIASTPSVTPGARVRVTLTTLNRSDAPLTLERIELPYGARARLVAASKADSGSQMEVTGRKLELNRAVSAEATVDLPADAPISQPYWLRDRPSRGTFGPVEPALTGLPEAPPALEARVIVRSAGGEIALDVPVVHRWVDPVQGERYRAFEVVPPITCRFDQSVYLAADRAKEVRLTIAAADAPVSGTARLLLPAGWASEPREQQVALAAKEERTLRFRLNPEQSAESGTLGAEVEVGGSRWSHRLVRIDHPHIPIQTLFPPAEARLIRSDVRCNGDQVGYVMGAGDEVPAALEAMGYRVTMLSDEEIEGAELSRFDAIVIGVRAYNTRPRLRTLGTRLLGYANDGGRLVVQYQTADTTLNNRIGPYPFTISRDRVTVEDAPMRFIGAAHPLLTKPNQIGPADFTGWVQERGLYYANPWDPRYQTVLSANDPGESPKDGGLLYARHGKGVFIYTGLSWFRQLPAGVPGAYRLFANLVSPERAR